MFGGPKKSKLNKAKAQFKSITGASDAVAEELCKMHNNNADRAINYYYENSHKYQSSSSVSKTKAGNESKLNGLFDKYAGEDEEDKDSMFEVKLEEYCKQIGLTFEGMDPIVLAFTLEAKSPGEVGRQEFVQGWKKLGIDTLADMKTHMTKELSTLKSSKSAYKKFYLWCFKFFLIDDQKMLDCDNACDLWSAVLTPRWELGEKWTSWIAEQGKLYKDKTKRGGIPCVSYDLWAQTLEFSVEVRADLSNWEDEETCGAYPTAIDDFVEHIQG